METIYIFYGIIIYTIIIILLVLTKPSIIYNNNKKQYKEFGNGHDKTYFTLPILSVILAVLLAILMNSLEKTPSTKKDRVKIKYKYVPIHVYK